MEDEKWQLSEGEYVPLEPDADGVVRSQVFSGLHLAVTALLDGDLARVLAELHKGLETAEYAAFVERLSSSGKVEGGKGRMDEGRECGRNIRLIRHPFSTSNFPLSFSAL